jgi:hypothetical protein
LIFFRNKLSGGLERHHGMGTIAAPVISMFTGSSQIREVDSERASYLEVKNTQKPWVSDTI